MFPFLDGYAVSQISPMIANDAHRKANGRAHRAKVNIREKQKGQGEPAAKPHEQRYGSKNAATGVGALPNGVL